MSAITFIGGGRITSALIAGLRLSGDRRRIVVYDRNPAKSQALRRQFRVVAADSLRHALQPCEILVIAVRPRSLRQTLEQIAECGASVPRICISLAAGIPLSCLKQASVGGQNTKWVRAMPSPVCRVGRGLTALCFDRGTKSRDRKAVEGLFARVGDTIEIAEDQFDAFTATYSSSHGYHALASLSSASRAAGLDEEVALTAAAHALGDAILYWRESGLNLADLLHEAATPGGIAAATMAAMDRSGYKRSVVRGLKAGIAQAKRNARS